MPVEFKMPDPGEGIHEAEILEILVSEGDRVEEDQPLMRIETDKADIELPAPTTGTVKQIRVSEGDIVEVGDVLMVIAEEGEGQDQKKREAGPADREESAEDGGDKEKEETETEQSESEEKKAAQAPKSDPDEEASHRGPVPATPATRRLARELDVTIEEVEASGPGGRVMPEDVKAHAEGGQKKPSTSEEEEKEKTTTTAKPRDSERPELPDFSQWGEVERTPLRSIRRVTAKRMALSWTEIPHVTHEDLADITELEKFRQDNKDEIEDQGGALTLTVFAIKAAVAALKSHPRFNTSLDIASGEIISKKYYNIGVAVDTDRGLLVPVVRNADCKSMIELAREVQVLAERTRQGEVEPKDMSGGTFTITNVGPLGGTGFTPIINYPQVAILGVAKARLQPVIQGTIDDYETVPRLLLPLCLGFDHRIVDGADAARFLGSIIELLEKPENLMLSQ